MTRNEKYDRKVEYLAKYLGPELASIPNIAKFIHRDEDTLRSDPTLPVTKIGTYRYVQIDSLAQWLLDLEEKGARI